MKKSTNLVTAGEIVDRLKSDPAHLARKQEQERILQERWMKWEKAEVPLIEALEKIGIKVTSVWDLVNTSENYTEVLPTLLKHLLLPYPDRIREGIARALAVKDATFAWPILVAEYCKAPIGMEDGLRMCAKDGLAAALSAIATEAVMKDLIALTKESSLGSSRILLLSALRKSKNPLAEKALQELANDPELSKEIASWRRKKK
jgi:hypothetical protein